MHSPTLSLTFRGPGGHGWLNLRLKGRGDLSGEFAKGMIAEFGFKSYELNAGDLQFLNELNDIPNQSVQLCLFSQGYLARTIFVGGFRDRWLRRWNRLAWRVNKMFERTVKADDGSELLKCPQILPVGQRFDFAIADFVRSLGTLPVAATDGRQNAAHPASLGPGH